MFGIESKGELRYRLREMELLGSNKAAEFDRALAFHEKRMDLEKEKVVEDAEAGWRDEQMSLRSENASLKVKVDQLEKRVAEAPYEQLSQILKALVVKLPTLNVSSLNVETKGGK